jgi:PAS domain S-box-containing protein
MVLVGHDGRMVLVNAQTEKLFGYARAELLGNPVEMLVPPRFRDRHPQQRGRYFAAPKMRPMGAGAELYGLRKDHSEFPVEISLSPIETEDGTLVASAIRDISDRKRAEEKLRESELNLRNTQAELAHMARVMTMGELTASIAHEVNQPLAAIVASGDSCTAWLMHEPPNLEKARAAASRMIQAATQASEIVQRLRALFKKTTSITVSVDLNAVIEDTISLVQHETQRHYRFAHRTSRWYSSSEGGPGSIAASDSEPGYERH